MKIRQLQLKNIGVFDDVTIKFQPCPVKDKAEIHIFTGQNGSGKTTLLMGLASSFDWLARGGWKDVTPRELSNDFQRRFRFDNKQSPSFTTEFDNVYGGKVYIYGDSYSKLAQTSEITFLPYNEWANTNFRLNSMDSTGLTFAVFAFSGYRHIEGKRVEALKETEDFNPLFQSLEFIKDYNQEHQLTINQLIANNISKSAIEKGRNEAKSVKFANVINSIQQVISEITSWKVEFDLETEPTKLITKVNGDELDFDVLPDGLRSLISWIADLLGKVDLLKWQDDLPIFEKNLILLLDEIEVHLHPAWQRKVLPVVQKLFKNSQIFVSTHSPFVVNSIDDAWVYKLKLENGKAKVESVERSEDGNSYSYVLEETFDIKEEFDVGVQKDLDEFYKLRNSILSNGSSKKDISKITRLAKEIAEQSEELNTIIQIEIRQINRKKELDLKI